MSREEKTKRIGIAMKGIVFFLLIVLILVLFLPATAFAQIEVEREGCEIREFREKAYTPFRVHMQHDPALKQRMTTDKNDPASRVNVDRVEIEKDEAPTNFSFITNSTDHWLFQIELEYLHERTEPREIIINYESDGIKFQTDRLFHEGMYFCIIIDAVLRPAPHEPTASEALALADMAAKQRIKTITDSNTVLFKEVKRSTDTNGVLSLGVVVIFLIWIAGGIRNKQHLKTLKNEYKEMKNEAETARDLLDTGCKEILVLNKKQDSFISQLEIDYRTKMIKPKLTEKEKKRITSVQKDDNILEGLKGLSKTITQKLPFIKKEIEKGSDEYWTAYYLKKTDGDKKKIKLEYNKLYEVYMKNPNEEVNKKLHVLFQLQGDT